MALPPEIIPPGCGEDLGKIRVVNPDQYARYVAGLDGLAEILRAPPALSDFETWSGGILVRLCGVDLVDRAGRSRPDSAILPEAVERLEVLEAGRAPATCIRELRGLIRRLRGGAGQ